MSKEAERERKKSRRTAALLGALKILASAFEVDVRADEHVGDCLGRGLGDKLVELPGGGGVDGGAVTSVEHAMCFGNGSNWAGGAHGGHGAQDDSCGFGVHFEVGRMS